MASDGSGTQQDTGIDRGQMSHAAVCTGAGERPVRGERYGSGSRGGGIFGRDGGVALETRAVWVECVPENRGFSRRAWPRRSELYRVAGRR